MGYLNFFWFSGFFLEFFFRLESKKREDGREE